MARARESHTRTQMYKNHIKQIIKHHQKIIKDHTLNKPLKNHRIHSLFRGNSWKSSHFFGEALALERGAGHRFRAPSLWNVKDDPTPSRPYLYLLHFFSPRLSTSTSSTSHTSQHPLHLSYILYIIYTTNISPHTS